MKSRVRNILSMKRRGWATAFVAVLADILYHSTEQNAFFRANRLAETAIFHFSLRFTLTMP